MSELFKEFLPLLGFLGYTIPLVFGFGVTYAQLKNKDDRFKDDIEYLKEADCKKEDRLNKAEQNIAAITEGFDGIKESLKRIEAGLYKHIDNHK